MAPLTFTLHYGPGQLMVEAHGLATLADLYGLADLVATVCAKQGWRRAGMNLLGVEHTQAISFTDHLQLGAYIAERLAHLERVASIVPQRYRTGTSEKAAQKAGLQLRTFTVLEEATAWLAAP
ncbi:hypothetical protein [Ramlibacter humi]|uniref:STAS/SEC14 domain-containing protein n=1 Tax=Ramlibacter humi TaxID=2530451 RepID=A0A4Z0C8M6_9BURK|nr:hypothetical protein [Ramlibacter humi]TFZ07641.1 hypothetical protein EZ216_00285 [Ramlibacter humi]